MILFENKNEPTHVHGQGFTPLPCRTMCIRVSNQIRNWKKCHTLTEYTGQYSVICITSFEMCTFVIQLITYGSELCKYTLSVVRLRCFQLWRINAVVCNVHPMCSKEAYNQLWLYCMSKVTKVHPACSKFSFYKYCLKSALAY